MLLGGAILGKTLPTRTRLNTAELCLDSFSVFLFWPFSIPALLALNWRMNMWLRDLSIIDPVRSFLDGWILRRERSEFHEMMHIFGHRAIYWTERYGYYIT